MTIVMSPARTNLRIIINSVVFWQFIFFQNPFQAFFILLISVHFCLLKLYPDHLTYSSQIYYSLFQLRILPVFSFRIPPPMTDLSCSLPLCTRHWSVYQHPWCFSRCKTLAAFKSFVMNNKAFGNLFCNSPKVPGRCGNSFVNYRLNYQNLCDLMR